MRRTRKGRGNGKDSQGGARYTQPPRAEYHRDGGGLDELEGITAVNISIYEIDCRVENTKITIEGESISYPRVLEIIEEMGGAVHSVYEVVAGKEIIDDADTLQD
jgi:hypothetical protein